MNILFLRHLLFYFQNKEPVYVFWIFPIRLPFLELIYIPCILHLYIAINSYYNYILKCEQNQTYSWEQRKLSEVADKVTEKNLDFAVQETFTNSAEFGVISQRDFFDHDISNADNIGGYYVVRDEDFVYNPRISVTAPVGPVNRNKLGRSGVMSPLYTVFRTHDIDTTYLEWFFKSSYWHPFMFFNGDSGARSDRFSIKDAVFFEMPIPLPSIGEQMKIGAYMDKIDNLITLQQCKAQKKNPAQSSGFSLETPYSTAYSSTFLTLGGVAVFLSSHGNVAFINTQNSIRTIITRITPFTMILTTLFPM